MFHCANFSEFGAAGCVGYIFRVGGDGIGSVSKTNALIVGVKGHCY